MNAPPSDFQIPEGFVAFPIGDGYADLIGPLYVKIADGDCSIGFRVEARHCNPAGICHGGMLMSVMDMALGMGASVMGKIEKFLPSMNLTHDFIQPGQKGDWIYSKVDFVEPKRRFVFANGYLIGSNGPVLRANGIMKIPSDNNPTFQFKTAKPITDKL